MKIAKDQIIKILHSKQIEYKEHTGEGNVYLELNKCVFDESQTDGAKIIFWKNGNVVYKCHHNSCKGKNIANFLEKCAPELLKSATIKKQVDLSPVKVSFTNGADLAAADIPPVRWIVDNFLPAGLVKLCGEPKTYKSYMALDLCLSVCLGRNFMGKHTQQAGAVYYDLEASSRRSKARMLQVLGDDPAPSNYYTHYGMEGIRLIGEGFESDLSAFLDDHPDVALVVIDVFIKIRPSRKANEVLKNEYLDTQGLWKIANDRNICIILVEHTNKQVGAKPFDRIAGANTSRGSTDVNMVIIREPDSDTDAMLSIEGREVITDQYVIRWDQDVFRWQLDGRFEELKKQRKLEKEYHEFFHHDAVKTIRGTIKEEGFWSGFMQELVDQAECDLTAKKMGVKIKQWTDRGFFSQEGVKVDKKFIGGKWKYTFKQ